MDTAPIAKSALDALTDRHGDAIAAVRRQRPALSHFEVLTGLALRHLADQKVGASLTDPSLPEGSAASTPVVVVSGAGDSDGRSCRLHRVRPSADVAVGGRCGN